MSKCWICKATESDIQIWNCDRCNEKICQTCSQLTASEIRCMELKKNRKLNFLCCNCEKKNSDKPDINLQSLLNAFKDDIIKEVTNNIIKEYEKTMEQQVQKIEELTKEIKNIKLTTNHNSQIQESVIGNMNNKNKVENTTENRQINSYASVSGRESNQQNEYKQIPNISVTKTNASNSLKSKQRTQGHLQNKYLQSPNSIGNSNGNITPSRNTTNNLMADQAEQMTNIININNDEGDNFKLVTKRNRKRKMGSGMGEGAFQGKNESLRKIWLFLTRVPETVKESDIKAFIHKKTKEVHQTSIEDIEVTKLHTITTKNNNQSFMIGVNPCLQEDVYQSNFWPRKIAYERFDFRRGQRFLNSQKSDLEASQPGSFLDGY
ncbi:unnamed protein product [Psylliodes chrysocephalus]|uniref:Uncharacterized protein n=1 Tax=Psylliodes chrysocephalus TaxID=3402493 RepID=A0A9P0CVZ0_9CUCU|nr:unnamed protein product [Psylliodes chrysocephala]